MKTFEIIRLLREEKDWSQRDMAEKLEMSVNGYAKIERGEIGINIARLEQIAAVLEVDARDLLPSRDGSSAYLVVRGNNNQLTGNELNSVYSHKHELKAEIETLKLMLQHKEELLERQTKELEMLKDMLAFIKNNINNS